MSNTKYCSGCFEKEYIVYSGFFRSLMVVFTQRIDLSNSATSEKYKLLVFSCRCRQHRWHIHSDFQHTRIKGERSKPTHHLWCLIQTLKILFKDVFKMQNKPGTVATHSHSPGKWELIRPDRESVLCYRAIKIISANIKALQCSLHHIYFCLKMRNILT